MANDLLPGKIYVLQIDDVTSTSASSGSDANYKTLACEVSHEFNITNERNPVSNKCGNGWTKSVEGDKGWSMSWEGQGIDPTTADPSTHSVDKIAQIAAEGKLVWVRRALLDAQSGAFLPAREGVVSITNHGETSNSTDPFAVSITLQGEGEPIIGQTT